MEWAWSGPRARGKEQHLVARTRAPCASSQHHSYMLEVQTCFSARTTGRNLIPIFQANAGQRFSQAPAGFSERRSIRSKGSLYLQKSVLSSCRK